MVLEPTNKVVIVHAIDYQFSTMSCFMLLYLQRKCSEKQIIVDRCNCVINYLFSCVSWIWFHNCFHGFLCFFLMIFHGFFHYFVIVPTTQSIENNTLWQLHNWFNIKFLVCSYALYVMHLTSCHLTAIYQRHRMIYIFFF